MLEPPSDRVLLRQRPPEERTAGGVYLPEIAQEDSLFCEVVAVGKGKTYPAIVNDDFPEAHVRVGLGQYVVPTQGPLTHYDWLAPGDVVVIPRHAGGTEIDYDGETLISILAEQVLAVVTDA
jgi:co-chaperonin GroES (HSP10)